jgi:hypothetical protein
MLTFGEQVACYILSVILTIYRIVDFLQAENTTKQNKTMDSLSRKMNIGKYQKQFT